MKVLDPGHIYLLDSVDGGAPQYLAFVKREGEGYPGNVGHFGGTQTQEVLRALINRMHYVDDQIPDESNRKVIDYLRTALLALEFRAADRHGLADELTEVLHTKQAIPYECLEVCSTCGHIVCEHKGAYGRQAARNLQPSRWTRWRNLVFRS